MIAKRACNPLNHARRLVPFESARAAFGAILKALDVGAGRVLLPSYVGWSAREGSGVFDPIQSHALNYGFYALDAHLRMDLDSLRVQLDSGAIRVLVLIHYFGYVDPHYAEAVQMAREHSVVVLEDEAHAMLSDLVGGVCGRLGDACIYSLHKLLPVESGGAAMVNDPGGPLGRSLAASRGCISPFGDFDLQRIASRRRANSLLLDKLLLDLAPEIEPLFGAPGCGEFPQSYPVLIRSGARDRVYQDMNAAGFGVVSLYHTLIPQIPPAGFPAAGGVSRHILNLPVHQDAAEETLHAMVRELARCVRRT